MTSTFLKSQMMKKRSKLLKLQRM